MTKSIKLKKNKSDFFEFSNCKLPKTDENVKKKTKINLYNYNDKKKEKRNKDIYTMPCAGNRQNHPTLNKINII